MINKSKVRVNVPELLHGECRGQVLLVASCHYSILPSIQGTHISIQCTAVNIRFSCAILKEHDGNSFLCLTDMSHI
jgi:hypothetical protein